MAATFESAGEGGWLAGGAETRVAEGGTRGAVESGEKESAGTMVEGVGVGVGVGVVRVRCEGVPVVEVEGVVGSEADAIEETDGPIGVGAVRGGGSVEAAAGDEIMQSLKLLMQDHCLILLVHSHINMTEIEYNLLITSGMMRGMY